MDQSTTTLLSTLLGGVLSTGGGFLATYLSQFAARKEDKRKSIKNMIEQIYKSIDKIESEYEKVEVAQERYDDEFRYLTPESNLEAFDPKLVLDQYIGDIHKIQSNIENQLSEVDFLITLYLSPLREVFRTYEDAVNMLLKKLVEEDENPAYKPEKESLHTDGKRFKRELANLLRKKGYSYL